MTLAYACFQLGKTKVFLRAGQMAELDARRAEVLGNAAKTIQRQIRTYISRKEFVSLRHAAILLQSSWRGNSLLSNHLVESLFYNLLQGVILSIFILLFVCSHQFDRVHLLYWASIINYGNNNFFL